MQKVANYLPKMYKALMPLVLLGIMELLVAVGLRPEMTLEETAGLVMASGLVWLKKNL